MRYYKIAFWWLLLTCACWMGATTSVADAQANLGSGRVTQVVALDGGCVSVSGNSVQSWNVQQGKTYRVTLSNVTECSGDELSIVVRSSATGNIPLTASKVSEGTYEFTITMPANACYTYPITYSCDGNFWFARRSDGERFQAHLRAAIFDSNCNFVEEDRDCGTGCPPDYYCMMNAPTVPYQLSGSVFGGTAPYTCNATVVGNGWSVVDCSVDSYGNISVTYDVPNPSTADRTATFTITVTDANNCTTECFVTVRGLAGCTVTPDAAVVCYGDTATFEAIPSGGVGTITYMWSGPNNYMSDQPSITVGMPGIYSATLTDGLGFTTTCCAALGVASINGPDELCTYLCGEYTAMVDFGFGVDTSGLTYSWSVEDGCTIEEPANGASVRVCASGMAGMCMLKLQVGGSVSFECDGVATQAFVMHEEPCEKHITVETCGCTPGYWKNHPGAWMATGYMPTQLVSTVFDCAHPYANLTLMQALNLRGGSGVDGAKQILLRAAVAALLNAAHPEVGYSCFDNDPAQVIAFVNAALCSNNRRTILDAAYYLDMCNNAQDCPLDGHDNRK